MSIMILVYVVLGGIGNFSGGIIATTVLLLLPELLRGMADYRMLIYSIVLIALMIFNWSPDVQKWKAVNGLTLDGIKARFSKNKEVQ